MCVQYDVDMPGPACYHALRDALVGCSIDVYDFAVSIHYDLRVYAVESFAVYKLVLIFTWCLYANVSAVNESYHSGYVGHVVECVHVYSPVCHVWKLHIISEFP